MMVVVVMGIWGKGWGQTAFTITYTGLNASAATPVTTGSPFAAAIANTVPFNGMETVCSGSPNGATTTYSTTLTANSGFTFTITSISGTAYASSAGSKSFQFRLVNQNGTQNGLATTITTSSSCSGNDAVNTLNISTNGNTTSGNTAVISVLRAIAGAESGTGYSRIKTIIISGTYNANCTPPADPSGSITGTTPACSSTSLSYSLPSTTSYWQTSATGTSQTQNTTTSYNAATSGTYYVREYDGTCWSTNSVASSPITINSAPAAPATIISPNPTCSNATQSFSIAAVTNATSYTWSTTGTGWSVASGGTTTNAMINVGTGVGTVSVIANNACGSSAVATTGNIASSTGPAQPGTISSSPATICTNQTAVYSIIAVAGATSYAWTVTGTGWSIPTASATTSVSVTVGSGVGTVNVTAINICGTSPSQTTGNITPNTNVVPGVITGATTTCPGSTEIFSVASIAGVSSYNWSLPSGWTIVSGQTTTSVTITAGTTSGNISVTATNACGAGAAQTLPVTVSSIAAPVTTAGTTVGSTSFTANWNAVAGATGYFVDVYTFGATTTLAQWSFPTNGATVTPDVFTANNSGKILSTQGGVSVITDAAGASTRSARAESWNSGSGTKFWQTPLNLNSYYNLKLSSKQRSSGAGPRDFKTQYKITAGGAWIDIPSGAVTVADNFTTGVLNSISLPVACENQPDVFVRWVMTSNLQVTSGNVVSTGASNFDDILITGNTFVAVAGYQNASVSGTSLNVTGLTTGTTYYYVVRANNGTCTSVNSNEIAVTTAPCTPIHTVTSFFPTSGSVGTIVTIKGTNFTGATAVLFGAVNAPTFSVVDANTITVEVPSNIISLSKISVLVAGCAVPSVADFTLLAQSGTCTGVMSDLIISEIFDPTSGNNHYIEIYNGTGSSINLSSPNVYGIEVQNNPVGNTTYIDITGTINAGETKVYFAGSNGGKATIPVQGLGSGFNEIDEIRLYKNAAIIDRVVAPNNVGFDFQRKNTVTGPTATYTAAQWDIVDNGTENNNNVGLYSAAASFTITTNPFDVTVCSFIMSVAASDPTAIIQWKYNDGLTMTGWLNVSQTNLTATNSANTNVVVTGATTSTLTLTGDIANLLNYQFYAEVTKTGCVKISNAAQYLYSNLPFYRSNVTTGDWTNANSWLMSNLETSGYTTTCQYPIALNSRKVIIQADQTISLNNIDIDIDELKIDGTLNIGSASLLTFNNGNLSGADLIINGTLNDNGSNGNGIDFVTSSGAAWQINIGGTLVRTNTSSSSTYRDNYQGGMSTIPANANWIIRGSSTVNVSFTSTGTSASGQSFPSATFYPNLTIESNSGLWSPAVAVTSSRFSGSSAFPTVKGNLNIGGTGAGTVTVFYENINATPFQILGNMEVKTGSTFTNAGNLNGTGLDVKGNMTIDGNLNVRSNNVGTLLLSGTDAQTIGGLNTIANNMNLENFIITNTVGVTNNKDFNIFGTQTFGAAAKLDFGSGNITLKSDANATANVAELPAAVSITYSGVGRYSIERYIQSRNSWRLLATPVQPFTMDPTSPTAFAAWQDGGSSTTSPTGFGTQITGPQPQATSFFDVYTQRGSLKYFDSSLQNYRELRTTDTAFVRSEGYYVFVRGNRGVPVGGASTTTTLRTRGKILTGSQNYILPANKFVSIGNPYPSRVDFRTIANPSFDNSYTAWNPFSSGNYNVGRFEQYAFDLNSGNYTLGATPFGTPHNFVESGQAIFVQSSTGGNLSFEEEDKEAGTGVLINRTQAESRVGVIIPTLEVALYANDTDGSSYKADGTLINFGNYINGIDNNDVKKILNVTDNLSIQKNGIKLVVERRQTLQATDTIFLSLTNTRIAPYRFEIDPSVLGNLPMTAYLKDKFLGTETPVSLTDVTNVNFSITSDAASRVADRFMIVCKPGGVGGPLPVNFVTITGEKNTDKTNTVKWSVANEISVTGYTIERSTNGNLFTPIGNNAAAANNGNSAVYNFIDATPAKATNYYRIKATSSNGQVQYSSIVKVVEAAVKPLFSVTPNPVENKTVRINFENMEGVYRVTLLSKQGASVYTTSLNVASIREVKKLVLGSEVAAGVYELRLINKEGKSFIQTVFIQ